MMSQHTISQPNNAATPSAFARAIRTFTQERDERRYRNLALHNLERLDDRRLYDLGIARMDLDDARKLPFSRSARQSLAEARRRRMSRR